MIAKNTNWSAAADQPGIAPYAGFSASVLIEDTKAGRLDPGDGVVLAVRLESQAAAKALEGAPVVLSAAGQRDLQDPGWPMAVSVTACLSDLQAVLDLAATTDGLVLVDVSQVLPADAIVGRVVQPNPKAAWGTPPEAIVAIIDDGIALGHGRFRDDAGRSRIDTAWVMDGVASGDHGHGYGRVLDQADLDGFIVDATGPGGFSDARFMALSGLVDHGRDLEETVAHAVAHGTGVLDLFAGHAAGDRNWAVTPPVPMARDAAARAPIIAVQFPSAQARDTSGAGLRPFVRDALTFVMAEVARMSGGGSPPVVINLSYGLFAGPHDGTHPIEQDIERILGAHDNVHLVLPAGNGALVQSHGRVTDLAPGAETVLNWRVLPDDQTPSFVEIWARDDSGAGLEVLVEGPDGDASGWVGAGQPRQVLAAGGHVLGEVTRSHFPSIGQGYGLLVALAPSLDHDMPGRVVDHGVWTVRVRNAGSDPVSCDAWVQRDVGAYGRLRRGRQSFLEDAAYVRFDEIGDLRDRDTGPSPVQREGTVSAMATGSLPDAPGPLPEQLPLPRLHVIGAWQGDAHGRPSMYTARTLDGARAPAMAAVADTSRIHRGVLTAGTGSATRVALNGTSVAAPQYARALLNALVDGNAPLAATEPPGTYQIKPGVIAPDGADRVGLGWRARDYVPDPPRRVR